MLQYHFYTNYYDVSVEYIRNWKGCQISKEETKLGKNKTGKKVKKF